MLINFLRDAGSRTPSGRRAGDGASIAISGRFLVEMNVQTLIQPGQFEIANCNGGGLKLPRMMNEGMIDQDRMQSQR